jgi:hypothetical protein
MPLPPFFLLLLLLLLLMVFKVSPAFRVWCV